MGLTVKQERYVQGLFSGKSQRQAYKEAFETSKMKDKTVDDKASLLYRKEEIRKRLQELQQEETNKSKWTRERLIAEFEEVKERCMTAIPVLDREGNETGEYKFEHTGATKSLENIGKLLGMYTEKIESTNTNINQDITMLSPEERKKRISELMGKVGGVDGPE